MIKYKLKKIRKRKAIVWISIILIFSLSLGTIARYYAEAVIAGYDTGSRIDGPTVIVNDSQTDYNYYQSLNYTEINENQQLLNIGTSVIDDVVTVTKYHDVTPKYTLDNLILVELNYSSIDINNDTLIGYVSGSEQQNKYTYYKYYPLDENGDINIELIDNPWTQRPTNYGFNGWVCDSKIDNDTIVGNTKECSEYTFSYDSQYYTRYLKIHYDLPADAEGNKKIILNLRTSWVKADITNDISTINDFKDKGLHPVSTDSDIQNLFTTTDTNLTGYFYKTTTVDNTSGLYYNDLGNVCTTENECTAENSYKLIQSSDTTINTGNEELDPTNYYYLVTRDTNIYEIPDNTLNLSQFVSSKPFTVTSSHDNTISIRTIASGNITTQNDFVLENVIITGGNAINVIADQIGNHIHTGTNSYYSLFANHNTKIGRKVSSEETNSRYTLDSIIGGVDVKLIVESGYYNDLVTLPINQQHEDIENYAIYGNDYDRITENNANLIVHFEAISSTSYAHNSIDFTTPVSTMTIKSGTYGKGAMASTDTNSAFYQYGIYAGTIHAAADSLTKSLRLLYVQGGKIVNVNGGPSVASDVEGISAAIYVTGGEIENLVGGAGTARSYGNRIVSVSDGQVNNVVVAGSNSYNQESINGPLAANTLAYIGGNARIGAPSMLSSNPSILFGVEKKGSVFGAGLGRDGYENSGIVDNSIVIINGGTITGDVYGGGNYGLAGKNVNGAVTNVLLREGTVEGSVYGGGNRQGFGNRLSMGSIDIDVKGGSYGSIYGGSNVTGLVNANININLIAGFVGNTSISPEELSSDTEVPEPTYDFTGVYGGGYGEETFVNGNINIQTQQTNHDILKIHNLYGGSANGTVNTSGSEVPHVEKMDIKNIQAYALGEPVARNVQVIRRTDLKAGDIIKMSNTNYLDFAVATSSNRCTATGGCPVYIAQPTLTQEDLEQGITYYRAITNASGKITGMEEIQEDSFIIENQGDVTITINGGTITGSLFGGGLGETADPQTDGIISITINSGKVADAYAGNDQRGTLENKVSDVGRIYYDKDGNSSTETIEDAEGVSYEEYVRYPTTLVINGGEIKNVYGGGRKAQVTNTILEINDTQYDGTTHHTQITDSVYGGSKKAPATETIVNLNSGEINRAYGGSNLAGTVEDTTVNNKETSVVAYSYGGGNYAFVQNSVNNFTGASIGSAFTGGRFASVGTGVLNFDEGTAQKIFGGCDQNGTVAIARTYINNGQIESVYGGNNEGGETSLDSLLRIDPNVCENCEITVENIYGGSKGIGAVSYNTNTIINGRSTGLNVTGSIYGGGYEAKTYGTVKLYLNNVNVTGEIYGGGFHAEVINEQQDETITGSYKPTIYVNLLNNIRATNIYGGGFYGFVGNSKTNSNNEFIDLVGTHEQSSANTYVNVINGTINGNIYGSGNAAFVYGNTHVNIGDNAINNIETQINGPANEVNIDAYFSDAFQTAKTAPIINITGTVFGGSETNTSETTLYTDSFKGVIGNAYVNISANNYIRKNASVTTKNLKIGRSIYGGGNNSAVDGKSYLLINKLGTEENPDQIISIQRANHAFIVDSYLYINGMQDRANASSTAYSLIRLDKLYLLHEKDNTERNGSTLYLNKGSTYLKEYFSGSAPINVENTIIDGTIESNDFTEFAPQQVVQNGENIEAQDTDNQIYIKDSSVAPKVAYLAIANGEEPMIDGNTTNAGSVHGMTFFGVFYNYNKIETNLTNPNDRVEKGIYEHNPVAALQIDDEDEGLPDTKTYAYVFGRHDDDVDIQTTSNGFYSNFYNEEDGTISVNYITPNPNNATYYRWELGERRVVIPVSVEANKYSQRTSVNVDLNVPELLLPDGTGYLNDGQMTVDKFNIAGFKYAGGTVDETEYNPFEGYLVDRGEIKTINTNDERPAADGYADANNLFALEIGTTESGWLDNYRTNLITGTGTGSRNDKTCNQTTCVGEQTYYLDSTKNLRSVTFWLYYSQNLNLDMAVKDEVEDDVKSVDMGVIEVEAIINKPNDPTFQSGIRVLFYISVKLTNDEADYYGTAMYPGKKYDSFPDKEVTIANDGSFSLYQKLSLTFKNQELGLQTPIANVNDLYYCNSTANTQEEQEANTACIDRVRAIQISGRTQYQKWGRPYRFLASKIQLPQGTRITMIDIINNKEYMLTVPQYQEDAQAENLINVNGNNIYQYRLTLFKEMGCDETGLSPGSCTNFDDDMNGKDSKYYFESNKNGQELSMAIEEFIFIIDYNNADKESKEYRYLNNEIENGRLPENYLYLTLAHDVTIVDNEGNTITSEGTNGTINNVPIVYPKGNPETDLLYRFTGDITSRLQLNGGFYDTDTKIKMDYTDPYEDFEQNKKAEIEAIERPRIESDASITNKEEELERVIQQKYEKALNDLLPEGLLQGDENYAKVYSDSNNLTLQLNTYLNQVYPIVNHEYYNITPIDTKFDDHSIGSKITIKKLNNDTFETFNTAVFNGLTVTVNGKSYNPHADGALRIPLSLRTSSITAALNFDFSNSTLDYGKYVMCVETFMSYDGVTYDENIATGGDIVLTKRYFFFELLDANYGLDISVEPVSITHDANTGKDENGKNEIDYFLQVKNGLSHPNLKIAVQRRVYENAYNSEYVDIDYTNIFSSLELIALEENTAPPVEGEETQEYIETLLTNDFQPFANGERIMYDMGEITQSERTDNEMSTLKYKIKAVLKDGPTDPDNPAQSAWKSGTYRIVVYLYDKAIEPEINEETGEVTYQLKPKYIGDTYEYLIIRSLDIDGEDGYSPSAS